MRNVLIAVAIAASFPATAFAQSGTANGTAGQSITPSSDSMTGSNSIARPQTGQSNGQGTNARNSSAKKSKATKPSRRGGASMGTTSRGSSAGTASQSRPNMSTTADPLDSTNGSVGTGATTNNVPTAPPR